MRDETALKQLTTLESDVAQIEERVRKRDRVLWVYVDRYSVAILALAVPRPGGVDRDQPHHAAALWAVLLIHGTYAPLRAVRTRCLLSKPSEPTLPTGASIGR